MKLNEGELTTPTFSDKNEEINGSALEAWSNFIKVLSDIEKEFQGEKEPNKDIYVTLLDGMVDEAKRRLENVDAIPATKEDDGEPKEEPKAEPESDEAPAAGEEGSEESTEESIKTKAASITEAERQTIRARELAGIPHPKNRTL